MRETENYIISVLVVVFFYVCAYVAMAVIARIVSGIVEKKG